MIDPTSQQPDPFHAVDRHVGARLRALRRERGLSQTALGRRLDVTFQQVQKYESGYNRISAGRLYHAALALEVPLMAFFDGYVVKEQRQAAQPNPKTGAICQAEPSPATAAE